MVKPQFSSWISGTKKGSNCSQATGTKAPSTTLSILPYLDSPIGVFFSRAM